MKDSFNAASFLPGLERAGVLGIIRGTDQNAAVASALALFEEGILFVEVTLTTPGALEAIKTIARHAPEDARVGAGTVMTVADVGRVIDAGARFVVTPAVVEAIAESARLRLPVLAGAFTATEAVNAMAQGATAVKLFPASAGGPGYLKALRDPLPHTPFVAVGGVGLAEGRDFLRAGAVALGVGGPLVGDAATPGGDLMALRLRARQFVDLITEAKAVAP